MGIFGALTSAISGLRAQSLALQHISDNIANNQTVGFKRTETSFVDLVSGESVPQRHEGGVVIANSRATNTVQGDIISSDVATHVAINGDGYFVVEKPTGINDGNPVFQGTDQYSRRGDFSISADGYLVNGAGYFLKALPVDPTTGNVSGTLPEIIQITRDFLPAQTTTSIDYRANLSQLPETVNYDPLIPNTELLLSTGFTNIPTTGITQTGIVDLSGVGSLTSLSGITDGDQFSISAGAAGPTTITIDNGAPATVTGTVDLGVDVNAINAGTGQSFVGTETLQSLGFSNGETITITTDSGTTTHTIVDATTENVNSVIATLTGNTEAGVVLNGGNLEATAANNVTSITFGGTGDISQLGLTTATVEPTNATIDALTGTASITIGANPPLNLDFSTITNRAQLEAQLGTLTGGTATINGSNNLVLTATANNESITISGAADTGLGLPDEGVINPTPETASVLAAEINAAFPGGEVVATVTAQGFLKLESSNGSPIQLANVTGTPVASLGLTTATTTGTVIGSDVSAFLDSTVAGGAITAFDPSGAPVNVQFRWGKVDSALNDGTDTWNLFYLEDSTATGTEVAWRNVGVDYQFGPNGTLTNPPVPATVTIPALTVDGVTLSNVNLVHGTTGLTQFADATGVVQVTDIDQDGYASGELTGVSISDAGRIVGVYSNGEALDVGEIAIATFNADDFLKKLDGGAFEATQESGAALLGLQGRLVAQSLEGSNADIADEFSKLIVTQQAYTAATRIVTTGDEMLQEAVNMVR